jgi:hypothetical protein
MENKIKFLVKKGSPLNHPHHVFSVLNLTTDFLPSQKKNLSRFPSINARKHRSMDSRMMRKTKIWIPHSKFAKNRCKQQVKKISFNELLSVKTMDTTSLKE